MKLIKDKKKFLIIVLILFVVLLFSSNTTFAAINDKYYNNDAVPSASLDNTVSDSVYLEIFAKLVYAIGRLIEWITGIIFEMLTGVSDYPWADKIVFNAVPLLDVNFINPGEGSFVINPQIQDVLKNLYSTILALAVSFFGIAVLITAIKLVISTIAVEKAKYKQAIVDWLIGFVMLFCIHYAISFMFYLNEQLVATASNIVTEQLKAASNVAMTAIDELANQVIANAESSGAMYDGEPVSDILSRNKGKLVAWLSAIENVSVDGDGISEAIMRDKKWYQWTSGIIEKKQQYTNLGMVMKWAEEDIISGADLSKIKPDVFAIYTYSPNSASVNGQCVTDKHVAREYNKIEQYKKPATHKICADKADKDCIVRDDATYTIYAYNFDESFENYKALFELSEDEINSGKWYIYDVNLDGRIDNGDNLHTNTAINWEPPYPIDIIDAYYLACVDDAGGYVKTEASLAEALKTSVVKNILGRHYDNFINNMSIGVGELDYIYEGDITNIGVDAIQTKLGVSDPVGVFTKDGDNINTYIKSESTTVGDRDYYYITRMSEANFNASKSKYAPFIVGGEAYVVRNDNVKFSWSVILSDLAIIKRTNDPGEGDPNRLISNLAEYFRYNAYNKELSDKLVAGVVTGDNARIQNMLMYTILVMQSLVLFIAYIKRLFYVIILAMMGPIVVVYDFFQKFGK